MAERVARSNLVRGILRELGFPIPVGTRHVVAQALALIDDPAAALPPALRPTIADACLEIRDLEGRARDVEKQLEALADQLPVAQRLQSMPGVGLLTATALVAAVGDVRRFPTGRHFASFLGLTPRERSSGLARHLGTISKRGDNYLRALLVNGARGTLAQIKRRKQEPDRLRRWALQVEALRGHNRAAVALANKLARIVWAVWRNDTAFVSHATAA
jgi:transposase